MAGFAEWHAAVCAGQGEIVCIQCALNADEALQLILTLHRPRAAWNDFTRIELALEQEPYFQAKALANQITGGKHKGLANLPKAQHIDVREKIADLAGVCSRTVGNVKTILKKAHPSLVEALHNGKVTINCALEVCKFERMQQVEELARFLMERSNSKTYREYINKLHVEQLGANLSGFFAKLQQFEATKPGSVEVRSGTGKTTVIYRREGPFEHPGRGDTGRPGMRYDRYHYKLQFGRKYDEPLKQILEKAKLYWDHDGVPQHVRTAFRKVIQCRTKALGAEFFASENGQLVVYHT